MHDTERESTEQKTEYADGRIYTDLPVFQAQADRLELELERELDGDETYDWVVSMCEGIQANGHSFFQLNWKQPVLRHLSEETRKDITGLFNRFIEGTEFMQCLSHIEHFQNGGKFENDGDVELYLNAQKQAGYNIVIEDELELVPKKFHNTVYSCLAEMALSSAGD